MDFNVRVYGTFNLFGQEIWITETVVTTYIIMFFLIVFALIVRAKLKKFEEVPNSGFQNTIEAMIEAMDSFVTSTMGIANRGFGGWFFGMFTLILVSNLSGLLGFRAPTADLMTTAAFAISTFFLIHFMGIKSNVGSYFKGYLEPFFLFLPMNIISEVATPVSLSFRLFGNLLGGTIIMGLYYSLPFIFKIAVPAVLHVYFDVFSGCLQAFIFVMLSMTFIKDKIPD